MSKNQILMKVISLAIFLFFFINSGLQSQIINIENKRLPSDTVGWFGSLGASFGISKDKSEVIQFSHNGHVQFKSKKQLALYIQDLSFLSADNQGFSFPNSHLKPVIEASIS